MDISDRLRHIMEVGRFTPEDVAEAVGCTGACIRSYMHGKTQPNAEMILRMCEFFRVSADYLLGVRAKSPGKYWGKITDIYKSSTLRKNLWMHSCTVSG